MENKSRQVLRAEKRALLKKVLKCKDRRRIAHITDRRIRKQIVEEVLVQATSSSESNE